MTSIEGTAGSRGRGRPSPPSRPVGKPSVLNNVETFANIAPIILKGAEWYAAPAPRRARAPRCSPSAATSAHGPRRGPDRACSSASSSTRSAAASRTARPTRPPSSAVPRAAASPRSTSTCPSTTPPLQELGAIMGSGGVIVMDEDTCMVDIARFFLEFTQEESCGKCPPCRVGTKRMLEIVERICHGEGEEGDIERLIALGETISQTALCGLGQTAPNPVLSTIRHFRHEYEAHIKDKYCEAGVCSTMFKARCTNACPASVNIPGFVSLVGEQRYDEALKLHRERNPLASICARVCFHPCESKCMRAEPRRLPGHPPRQALHGGAGEGAESCRRCRSSDEPTRTARSPSSAPAPPASVRRVLPRPPRLQADRLRGRAQGGRHARAGHPRLPSAA